MALRARAELAFLLAFGFAGFGVGLRVALQWRRTGTTGVVLNRMGQSRADRVVLVGLVLATGALAVSIGAALAGQPLGGPEEVPAPIVFTGGGIAVLAIASAFWAQLAMGASWRIGLDRAEATALVTGGPFRWVRNPIYTAMIAFCAGLCAVLPGPLTAFTLAVGVAAIEAVVRFAEEPFLRARHGAAYAQWAMRAGRFVPGVGRMRVRRDASTGQRGVDGGTESVTPVRARK